jgi:hypothetical protein
MFLSKLKMASVFVLVLVAISSAGVTAYHLQAQPPAPEPATSAKKPAETAPARPAAKAPEKEADTLAALMQERLKLAQKELAVSQALFENARVDFDVVATAWKNVLKADLELRTKRADRIAVYERHIKVLEQTAKLAQVRYEAARATELGLLRLRYLLVDAKIELEREKSRK